MRNDTDCRLYAHLKIEYWIFNEKLRKYAGNFGVEKRAAKQIDNVNKIK